MKYEYVLLVKDHNGKHIITHYMLDLGTLTELITAYALLKDGKTYQAFTAVEALKLELIETILVPDFTESSES
jgi:hypothetical protein